MNFQQAFFDELEKTALSLGSIGQGIKSIGSRVAGMFGGGAAPAPATQPEARTRIPKGLSFRGAISKSFGPERARSSQARLHYAAERANVGSQFPYNYPAIPPMQQRSGVPPHQIPRAAAAKAYELKRLTGSSLENPEIWKRVGFQPATTSGAKPLSAEQKAGLRGRLVGAYRERHGLGGHISDENIAARMRTGAQLGARRAGRLLKVGGFRPPKILKPKGGPFSPFARTFRLGARLAGSVTGTNVR